MKNRLTKSFETNADRKAFVPYVMAGDGGLDSLKDRLLFLEKNGATAVEIGIPFSDPVADGPVIQAAGIRALQEGTTLKNVLQAIKEARQLVKLPLLIMTYMNPVLAYGLGTFAQDAKEAGVDGCIIPDMPIEEEEIITPYLEEQEIELIRLVTLTSPESRIKAISEKGNGFLYAVTVTGITGKRTDFSSELGQYLKRVKEVSKLPVLAGFGISTPDHVKQLSQYCDGVIVGSKVVELFHNGKEEEIITLIKAASTVEVV